MDHGRTIELDARSTKIVLDLAKSAVIVVDMQNDFGSKGGLFDHAGVDISMIQKAVVPTRNVLMTARRAAMKIVYLKMGFQPDLSDIGADDSPNRVRHLHFGVGLPSRAHRRTISHSRHLEHRHHRGTYAKAR
jgi:nicotinamidase-related amidase